MKKCPFSFNDPLGSERNCDETCGWWDKKNNQCAIVTIAQRQ
jgi:hypothetical protein